MNLIPLRFTKLKYKLLCFVKFDKIPLYFEKWQFIALVCQIFCDSKNYGSYDLKITCNFKMHDSLFICKSFYFKGINCPTPPQVHSVYFFTKKAEQQMYVALYTYSCNFTCFLQSENSFLRNCSDSLCSFTICYRLAKIGQI